MGNAEIIRQDLKCYKVDQTYFYCGGYSLEYSGFYGVKSQLYTLNFTLVDQHRCRAADGVIDFLE